MKLETLTPRERLSLCRRAATAAVRRLRLLAQGVNPKDGPLRRLLESLLGEEERHLAEIGRFEGKTGVAPIPEGQDLDSVLAWFFPSLSKAPGEGYIDRETGSYFAERLEEEAAQFYRALAEQAPDEESRAFFHHWEADQEAHRRFVQTVLL